MSSTIRTPPYWVASNVEYMRDPEYFRHGKYARKAERMERGADGAFRSDNFQSAKAGRLDNWSPTAKGRNNKRIATKQIRRYHKEEIRREMEAEEMEDAREMEEAKNKASEIHSLMRSLYWAQEDIAEAERTLQWARDAEARLSAKIRELGGDPSEASSYCPPRDAWRRYLP